VDEAKRRQREEIYDRLGEIVDGIVTQASKRHYTAPTQEHQFSSKIADRLDDRLSGLKIGDTEVSIHVQDFTDKGSGSQEFKTGADLYISVVAESPDETINKGMIVQSKWEVDLRGSGKELMPQVGKMRARTPSSYVWGYGPAGIAVLPSTAVAPQRIDRSKEMTVGELIAAGLKCTEGDPQIARDLSLPPLQGLTKRMEELAADIGVAVNLKEIG
jgi:hypothetical protein